MAIAVILGALIGLTIGCLIGATILRSAVHAYNKLVARMENSDLTDSPGVPPVAGQAVPPPASSQNPYAAPSASMAGSPSADGPPLSNGIRMPNFGHAVGIVFVRSLVNGIISYGITFLVLKNAEIVGGPGGRAPLDPLTGMWEHYPLVSIAQLVISFIVGLLFLTVLLPTKLKKAAIVQAIEYVVYLVILLMIGLIVFAYTGGTMRL